MTKSSEGDVNRIEPYDRVSIRRPLPKRSLETMKAQYVRQSFKPHAHDEYVIGMIESGVHSVWCRGEYHHISEGTVVTMHPGDVHHGGAGIPAGWRQRMIYVSEGELSSQVGECHSEDKARTVEFRQSFHRMPDMAKCFGHFHEVLHSSELTLAREVALDGLLRIILGILSPIVTEASLGNRTDGRIGQAVDYLRANVENDVTLNELCEIAGLRRRQTIDAFKRKTGLPPHAYHVLQKVNAVKAMLRDGMSATEAAASAGFADQSHMTRHFVAVVGMTPSAYAHVRDSFHMPHFHSIWRS